MNRIARLTFCFLTLVTLGWTVEKKSYDTGTLTEMNAVRCGTDEKSGQSFMGSLIGTDNSTTHEREALCQEYTLKTDHVVYKFRPRDEKHPVLLPVGGEAKFRVKKDKLILRMPDADDHEREYTVTSMQMIQSSKPEQQMASK